MTTHLAEHFRKVRLQKGLRFSEVALRMGYQRTERSLSHGCNRLHKFETSGDIDIHLFEKLMAVLEIDQATVNKLNYQDYAQWFLARNQPVAPFILLRGVWGCPAPIRMPERLKTVEEMEGYAADYAKRSGWDVYLCFNDRIRIGFCKDGTFQGVVEEVPREE